jgi:hypothetical protein
VETAFERIAADEQALASRKYYRFGIERVERDGFRLGGASAR